jgi:hypothetical protein
MIFKAVLGLSAGRGVPSTFGGRASRSGPAMPHQQWKYGPGWSRMPRLIEALARISPAPAAALLLARGASSSAV